MDPFTIALVVSAIGGAFSAYSGQQSQKQAGYNADANAKAMKIQADQEEQNQRENSKRERKLSIRKRAAMTARYASSGLMLTGTPAEVLADQAAASEVDIAQTAQDSKRRTMGLRISSANKRTEAKSYSKAGDMALIGGLVNTGASAMNQYAWWNK